VDAQANHQPNYSRVYKYHALAERRLKFSRSRSARDTSACKLLHSHAQTLTQSKSMIKRVLPLVVVSLLVCSPAFAKTLKVPNDEFPIAAINIPDSWEPEEINNGVACESPDKAVYLAVVAVGSDKGMNAEIDDTFEFLKAHNVQLDKSTKQEDKFKINDFDAEELTFQGKDENGPAAVSIAFVTIKNKVLVFTYWVSTEDEKEHQAEVGKILKSLKPAS
jgi:hypothetical protein